jgi:hypothetical protein
MEIKVKANIGIAAKRFAPCGNAENVCVLNHIHRNE